MVDAKVAALTSAGLLHDLGKFAERAGVIEPGDPDWVRQEYNYAHAHGTSVALEQCFGEAVNRAIKDLAADENLSNLASRHHKPRTDLERLLQKADWVASGHERREADEAAAAYETTGRERKSQVPLVSLLSRVSFEPGNVGVRMRHRITPFSETFAAPKRLYPVSDDEYPAEQVRRDYEAQWQKFYQATKPWRENGWAPMERIDPLIELLRDFQWCQPASTRKEELPDISLFEHQKGTAALAASLYQYQCQKENLLAGLGDDEEEKFLLCGCDISGIQNFIYQISSKGAYRHLKGRSFYIQLLAEMASRELLSSCGLTSANLLYASGGKGYLLLANTSETKRHLTACQTRFNQQLNGAIGPDLFLRVSWVPLSVKDLCRQSGRTLCVIWEELTRSLGAQDRARLQSMSNEELQGLFSIPEQWPEGGCEICHSPLLQKTAICPTCEKLGELGRGLGRADAMRVHKKGGLLPGDLWVEPTHVGDVDNGRETEHFILLNRLPHQTSLTAPAVQVMMVGGNQHPKDEFQAIAEMANGTSRLGILRMDVDNLGHIFAEGLRHYRHDHSVGASGRFHSLGRVTTLSWQLSTFFSVVLRHLVEKHPENQGRVSIVYAGGDDLFILGAWDALPKMAATIQWEFRQYCAGNPIFSLSGGLVLTGGKFPVYKGAELAGESEKAAKDYVRNLPEGGQRRKHALCFLNTPLDWRELEQLEGWFDRLVGFCRERENRPLLRHLQRIADLWVGLQGEKIQQQVKKGVQVDLRQVARSIEAEKWCWRMVYGLARFKKRQASAKGLIDDLQEFITQPVRGGERQGIELLGLLCRWCELYLKQPEPKDERRAM